MMIFEHVFFAFFIDRPADFLARDRCPKNIPQTDRTTKDFDIEWHWHVFWNRKYNLNVPSKTIVVFHPSTFLDSTTQKVHLQRNQPHGLPTYPPKNLWQQRSTNQRAFSMKRATLIWCPNPTSKSRTLHHQLCRAGWQFRVAWVCDPW